MTASFSISPLLRRSQIAILMQTWRGAYVCRRIMKLSG